MANEPYSYKETKLETAAPATEAQAIINELRARVQVEDFEGERPTPIAFVPKGVDAISLKPLLDTYLDWPERRANTVELLELQSLADYVNRFKTEESIVYLDDSDKLHPEAVVVFDEHARTTPPGADGTEDTQPAWRQFRAVYKFPLTPEWQAWTDISKGGTSQGELARFLEDHVMDVCDPSDPGESAKRLAEQLGLTLASPQKLLSLSRSLAINADVKVANAINLTSGEQQIRYEETHNDETGKPINVPGGFAIAVPVFRGGLLYRIAVRLQYRLREGKVTWFIKPHRMDLVYEDAIEGAAKQLREKTALPVLRGVADAEAP